MIIVAYLREGRVHASREAYEGGDGIADYTLSIGLDSVPEIEAVIAGQHYRSLWCWPFDSQKPWGAVPLIRVSDAADVEHGRHVSADQSLTGQSD